MVLNFQEGTLVRVRFIMTCSNDLNLHSESTHYFYYQQKCKDYKQMIEMYLLWVDRQTSSIMEPRFLFNENFTFSPNGPYRVRIDGVIYFLLCEFYTIVIVTERSSRKQYYYNTTRVVVELLKL